MYASQGFGDESQNEPAPSRAKCPAATKNKTTPSRAKRPAATKNKPAKRVTASPQMKLSVDTTSPVKVAKPPPPAKNRSASYIPAKDRVRRKPVFKK